MKRVSITLPEGTVEEIDRHDSNRSRFVQVAVAHELERRRRLQLERSLDMSHVEAGELAEAGFDEWLAARDESDLELVDLGRGTPVRWQPGRGWLEIDE